ncbi:MAG TPA: DUF3226 domain-containing protein [Pirellulales bacterium]|nr:DUF3226 domain-containing protein [Pirellulales bacterium]
MGRRLHPKKLLVEGEEDKRVIPQLIEAHGVEWGENRQEWIVLIEQLGGIEPLLESAVIETELKVRGLEVLGIVVDANDSAAERWKRIRNRCAKAFPSLPETLPNEGLIDTNVDGLKLGVWLMPDNRSRGMLETFLACLLGDETQPLWQYANETVVNAKDRGAPFTDAHEDKARIHTWLAWQDPPGRQLHDAVKFQMLKPSPLSAPFVAWFRSLYGV